MPRSKCKRRRHFRRSIGAGKTVLNYGFCEATVQNHDTVTGTFPVRLARESKKQGAAALALAMMGAILRRLL